MPRRYHPRTSPRAGAGRHRHRVIAWAVYTGLCLLVAAIIYAFRAVLLPFIIGAIIAYVLAPSVNLLARKGLPRVVSVLLVYVAFFAGVYGFFHYLVPKLQAESRRFAQRFHDAPRLLSDTLRESEGWIVSFFDTDPGADGRSAERLDKQRVLNRYGLGPDTWRAGSGHPLRLPLLDTLTSREALAPGSALAESLGLVSPEAANLAEGLDRSHIVATIRDDRIGIQVLESTLEFREIADGVYRVAPRQRAADREGFRPEDIRAAIRDALGSAVHQISTGTVRAIVSAGRGLVTFISRGLVGLIVTFMVAAFILLELADISLFFRSKVPRRYHGLYDELLGRLDRGLTGVVRGQLIICLINGVLSFIGFLIFVPEYAVVLAVLATVMTLIPIFGTIISTVPACLLALSSGGWGPAVAVLGWVLGVHFIEANILNPKIIGAHARINPVVIVFVLIAGEHAYGLKGALLAVPTAAVVIAVAGFIYTRIESTLMREF